MVEDSLSAADFELAARGVSCQLQVARLNVEGGNVGQGHCVRFDLDLTFTLRHDCAQCDVRLERTDQ